MDEPKHCKPGTPLPDRLAACSTLDIVTGCIEWTRPLNQSGYGVLWVDGRHELAHRIAWRLANGAIPDGLCVLHHCDNRACVNTDHLFIGTRADNVADMWAKGRQPLVQGEKQAGAKLTNREAAEIFVSDLRTVDLCRIYGVASVTIWKIQTGRSWTHVTRAAELLEE